MSELIEFRRLNHLKTEVDAMDINDLMKYGENPVYVEEQDMFVYKGQTYKKEEIDSGWNHK